MNTDTLAWFAEHGATFVLVKRRDKRPIEDEWQKRPHDLDAARAHVASGGNVGLLCGEPSALLGLLDVDRIFDKFLAKFPEYTTCPRVVRHDAPDKAKLVFRVTAPVPPAKWIPIPAEKSPWCEWLFTGNQGVLPPSFHPDGAPYVLENAEHPIPSLTPAELDKLWFKWTRERLLPQAAKPRQRQKQSHHSGGGSDPELERIKQRIREKFDMEAYAGRKLQAETRDERGEVRVLGQGGLFVDGERWNTFAENNNGRTGGDCFALIAYLEDGTTDLSGARFWEVLRIAADEAGVILPPEYAEPPTRFSTNGTSALKPAPEPRPSLRLVDEATGEIVNKGEGTPPDLLAFEASDEGNAEAVFAVHGARFRHVEAWGWLHYAGTHWTTTGAEAALGFAVVDTLRERRAQAAKAELEAVVKIAKPSRARVNACIDMLRKHVFATPDTFDQVKHLLNVANGVLDLRTGELAPHSPQQLFTYCVPIRYCKNANCEEWVSFLGETVEGGRPVIDYLQEAVGYSLTGETREECLFYVYGETRSGKGTFATVLQHLLGEPLAMAVSFNTFANQYGNASPDAQNFALAPLKPARIIFASESGKYASLQEAKVKELTGGDKIQASFKGRDHFYYYPQFKIWLLSNWGPRGDVDDDALWQSRIKVLRFPYSKLGREDKTLKARLTSDEVLEGVLAWAAEGARRWYNRSEGLIVPDAVTQATNHARAELDTLQQWLDECCEPSLPGESFAPNSDIQGSYKAWCEANGHKPLGARMLGRSLTKKGFERTRQHVGGRLQRGYTGLRVLVHDTAGW